MAKKIIFSILLVLTFVFTGCLYSGGDPQIVSMNFIDDKTLEWVTTQGDDGRRCSNVGSCSFKPNDNYSRKYCEFSWRTGKIHFNKEIADGCTVTVDFKDEDGKYICTESIVKGQY